MRISSFVRQRSDGRDWTGAGEGDLGSTLVELLSYIGDLLASYQAQIAAEARLRTARRYAFALAALALLVCWRRGRGELSRG